MSDDLINEPPVAEEATVHDAAAPPPSTNASIVLKRSGVETDIEFTVNPPAIIGRFDPTVGPIDIDLGGLPEGSYISRRHAKITLEDGVWMLHDLGSSNGTFLLGENDFERHESAALHDGAEFALGNARFAFHSAGAVAAPPVADHAAVPTLDAEPVAETESV